MLAQVQAESWYPAAPTTQLLPASDLAFYPAEPEHQGFFAAQPYNGYCRSVVSPKLVSLRAKFKEWMVDDEDLE